MEYNLNTIKKIGFKNKLVTIAVVLGFMLVFSVYFVASYIMATNNYDAYWDASNTLNTIFSV